MYDMLPRRGRLLIGQIPIFAKVRKIPTIWSHTISAAVRPSMRGWTAADQRFSGRRTAIKGGRFCT